MIRENEIFKRVSDVIKMALEQLGLNGFEVLQQFQPIATNDHACVLISKVNIHRYGWQGVEYEKETITEPTIWQRTDDGCVSNLPAGYDSYCHEKWNYIDEVVFQVSTYLPRKVGDSATSITAYDALSAIATWIMSHTGINAMLSQSLQPLRISDIRIPVQSDDSGIPQFNPNFDMHFLVKQQSGIKVPMIEAVVGDKTKMDGRHLF